MPENPKGFIRAAGREMPLASVGLNITPNAGAMEDIAAGRPYHTFGLWVEPAEDQFPYLLITDVDLYVEGEIPAALDGLRLSQSLHEGDYVEPELPWIRPGSMTGMAEIVFEPPSARNSRNWNPGAGKYLQGDFHLSLDRVGDLWRVEVRASHEDDPPPRTTPSFHAVFFAELEIEGDAYDEPDDDE
ncbi:MAG: hypothetical protein R3B68_13085 [Phycisphaerales bacterium]